MLNNSLSCQGPCLKIFSCLIFCTVFWTTRVKWLSSKPRVETGFPNPGLLYSKRPTNLYQLFKSGTMKVSCQQTTMKKQNLREKKVRAKTEASEFGGLSSGVSPIMPSLQRGLTFHFLTLTYWLWQPVTEFILKHIMLYGYGKPVFGLDMEFCKETCSIFILVL